MDSRHKEMRNHEFKLLILTFTHTYLCERESGVGLSVSCKLKGLFCCPLNDEKQSP